MPKAMQLNYQQTPCGFSSGPTSLLLMKDVPLNLALASTESYHAKPICLAHYMPHLSCTEKLKAQLPHAHPTPAPSPACNPLQPHYFLAGYSFPFPKSFDAVSPVSLLPRCYIFWDGKELVPPPLLPQHHTRALSRKQEQGLEIRESSITRLLWSDSPVPSSHMLARWPNEEDWHYSFSIPSEILLQLRSC